MGAMPAMRQFGLPQREITVKKSDLMEKLVANREQHIRDFTEACEGYKAQAIDKIESVATELKERILALKSGKMIDLMSVSFGLSAPRSYAAAYDQVIEMLKMDVAEEVTLRSDEFTCYVLDEWEWSESFGTTVMNYSKR